MSVIRALFVYPVKSCGGIALEAAQLYAEGLKWDRHWMVVDETGRMASQREYATMARVACAFVEGGVRLSSVDMDTELFLSFLPQGDARRVRATVWKDTVDARDIRRESHDAQRHAYCLRTKNGRTARTCRRNSRMPFRCS